MDPHPLRAFRDRRKLTQDELARLLGVATMTVSRWERGRMPWKRYWPVITEKTGVKPSALADYQATQHFEATA